jgi:monomeric isocitrate dehydrogenase
MTPETQLAIANALKKAKIPAEKHEAAVEHILRRQSSVAKYSPESLDDDWYRYAAAEWWYGASGRKARDDKAAARRHAIAKAYERNNKTIDKFIGETFGKIAKLDKALAAIAEHAHAIENANQAALFREKLLKLAATANGLADTLMSATEAVGAEHARLVSP